LVELSLDVETVKGFLDAEEGEALYRHALKVARLAPCFEVGAYCGRSTVYLGTACRKVGAMLYSLDQADGYISLSEYVEKGITLLDNPDGFFMMVEGGKIDWACHANDAAASIHDTLAFDEAVASAYAFYEQHPDETLIIVTGDHETGGMTIGFAGTQYSSFVDKIQNQSMSYEAFDAILSEYKETHTPETAKLEDLLPAIEEAFGLYVLSPEKRAELEKAVADGNAEGASDEAKKAGEAAQT